MKPNTVCQVRGIQTHNQRNMNGMIVITVKQNPQFTTLAQAPVWEFQPLLKDTTGRGYNHALERHLYPLDPCESTLNEEIRELERA